MTMLVDLGAVPMGRTVALVLAQSPEPPPDRGEEFGKASPVGLVVILLLGIATMFLIRSMTKRLRRLPASFDPPEEPEALPPDARSPDAQPRVAEPRVAGTSREAEGGVPPDGAHAASPDREASPDR